MRRLLIAAGALFLCGKAYCLTLSDAETEVRRLVKDTATSATLQRYSDTVLDAFLNQAQREVVNQTWCLQKSTGIVLTANTTFYSLPTDLIAVKLVRFVDSTGRTRNLTETSYKAVQESNPDYVRQTGPPMQYILRYSTSAGTALQLSFMPTPTSSSTGTATIDYYKQSTDLSSDSDTLLDGFIILLPYHEAVIYQVVGKIKLIEGDTTGAAAYFQLYATQVATMNSRLGERPNLNPGFSAGNAASFSGSGIGK